MDINQRFRASEKIPNSRQSAVQADELSNSNYQYNTVIGQHILFSPWRHYSISLQFSPKKIRTSYVQPFLCGYNRSNNQTELMLNNELPSFLPKRKLIKNSLGMRRPVFGKWLRNRSQLSSVRTVYVHTVSLDIIHVSFHYVFIGEINLCYLLSKHTPVSSEV